MLSYETSNITISLINHNASPSKSPFLHLSSSLLTYRFTCKILSFLSSQNCLFSIRTLFSPLLLALSLMRTRPARENTFRPLSLPKLITSARGNLSVIASFNKFPKRLAASNKLLSAGTGLREREASKKISPRPNIRRGPSGSPAPRPVSLGSTPDRTGPQQIFPREDHGTQPTLGD